jgi:signal transduction histidine kinase
MSSEGIRSVKGYVRVGLSFARIQGEIRQELGIISLVALAYVLVGVLVAFLFYQMILGPVEGLIDSVKRFRRDRRARAAIQGSDELALLAAEFNKMADTIAERDERLERMNRKLLEANRVKSEFLAMMGHELKTPLHSIRGFSQLLLEEIEGPLTSKQQEDIAAVLALETTCSS